MNAPLTPPDCDLRSFPRMMIDVTRLQTSDFDAMTDDTAWRAGLNLWMASWHAVPAGSLSDDDALLAKAAGLGRDLRTWRKVRPLALRGFRSCDDGRLYHATVCEFALEAWIEKLVQQLISGAGNAKRWGGTFDPAATEAAIDDAVGRLQALAPQSKAIAKARRRHSKRDAGDGSDASGGDPIGTGPPSQRDDQAVPMGSQEKGEGTGEGKEEKNIDDGGRLRVPDPGKGLAAALQRIAEVGGIPLDPTRRRWADELDRLKGWLAKGLDLERDILPATERTLAKLPVDDAIGSLQFIERELFGRRARDRTVAAGAPAAAAPTIVFEKPGEGGELTTWRRRMAAAIGEPAYRRLLDDARLALEAEVLHVTPGTMVAARKLDADHVHQLRGAAEAALGIRIVNIDEPQRQVVSAIG